MLYPLMLLGMLGLAVPIILHLIQRQRLKPQVLATMQFLDPQDAANAFAPVPRDKLQLLLRLLLLGLFVLLMTRLFTRTDEVGPRNMVVVFDQSLSMQRRLDDGTTLLERHRTHLLELIDGMVDEDRLALILVGDEAVEMGFSQDRAALRQRVEGIEASDGGGLALGPAIRRAAGMLEGRREINALILVFSDHLRVNYDSSVWEIASGVNHAAASFREHLEAGRTRLILIDEQPPRGTNLSIDRASLSPSSVHVGASSRMTATISNHTNEKQTTQVRVSEGEQSDAPRSLTLAPGETAHIDLVHRFESPVDSVVRVEIDEDVLPVDNRFTLPMRIRDRRQVLLVTPPNESGEERNLEIGSRGVDLLSYALNPGEVLGRGAGTFISVKRVTPQGLARVSLPLYSLVILQGVTDLSEQAGRDLSAFVENGGGVWLIPEGDVSPVRFQAAYDKLLGGFTLGALRQADPVQPVSRDEAKVNHPLLLPMMREEWGNLREITFGQYHAVETLGTGRVALRAGNGDPLAIMTARGRGQVFVQLFGTNLDASTLPRTMTFVPFVQHVSATLGGRRESLQPDTMRVGEVRTVEVPEFRGLKGEVEIKGPSSQTVALTGEDKDEVRVEKLSKAGAYKLSHPTKQTSRQRWLSVNPAMGAADLRPLDEEFQAMLFGTNNVSRLSFREVAGEFRRAREILPVVVVLVFILFAVEALVGAWQSRRRLRYSKNPQAATREAAL